MLYNTTPNETKGLKIVPLSQSEQQAGCACRPWPHMSENRVPYFNPNSNAFLSLMFAHVFFPIFNVHFFFGFCCPASGTTSWWPQHIRAASTSWFLALQQLVYSAEASKKTGLRWTTYGSFQSHGGSPSHHPFQIGIFHDKNHPAMGISTMLYPPF